MSLQSQPAFIVTVGGRDVTADCVSWRLNDSERGQSSLTVRLNNTGLRNSGIAQPDDPISIRFGEAGNMGGEARLNIKARRTIYGDGGPFIEFTGRDDQEKLCGGKGRGMFRPGMTPREIQQSVAKAHKLKLQGDGDGPKFKDVPFPVCNETPRDILYATQRPKKPQSGGGKAPTSQLKKGSGKPPGLSTDEWDVGDLFSGTGKEALKKEAGKLLDSNRAANNANTAAGEQVTATLKLRGYPRIKAKGTVTITNVAGEDAGTYYVQEAEHSWSVQSGYLTTARLIRGGTGKGAAGGDPPYVLYADIWNKGKLYGGQRKIGGSPQGTFRVGQDEHVISFEVNLRLQSQRGGGEQGTGTARGIDFRKRGKPYKAAAKSDGGSGGGGDS
jgi:hypothetical protein